MGGRGSSSGLSNGSGISTVERKICHDEVESAYLFDTDGNVIFSKSDNTKNYVTFSEEQVKQFEDNILTHNHPGGSTFSCEDVSLLTYSKMQEIRATTSKGTFSLRANKDSKSYEKGSLAFSEDYSYSIYLRTNHCDGVYEKLLKVYRNFRIDEVEFQKGCDALNSGMAEFRNTWLEENSHKYGYIYRFQGR